MSAPPSHPEHKSSDISSFVVSYSFIHEYDDTFGYDEEEAIPTEIQTEPDDSPTNDDGFHIGYIDSTAVELTEYMPLSIDVDIESQTSSRDNSTMPAGILFCDKEKKSESSLSSMRRNVSFSAEGDEIQEYICTSFKSESGYSSISSGSSVCSHKSNFSNQSSLGGDSMQSEATYNPTAPLILKYFKVWDACTILLITCNLANINWSKVFYNSTPFQILLLFLTIFLESILNWSSLELALKSFAVYFSRHEEKYEDGSDLGVIINYNLLASDEAEIDACLQNQYDGYVGNMSPSVVACLVSATGEPRLQNYEIAKRDEFRKVIYDLIISEGKAWANGNTIDHGRAERCFEQYRLPDGTISAEFLQQPGFLEDLASSYAQDFMVVSRATRSLRKCGQYQDLMLLNAGCNECWTYTDDKLYNELARRYGEHMFYPSEDVSNIMGRNLEYTLVLDGDTGIVKDSLAKLMDVAAAHPTRAIIQPSIDITAGPDDSLFMHLDSVRQKVFEPVSLACHHMMGRCGFFGKGLLKNDLYITTMLGDPFSKTPYERVPIDVLSHDTYEAAALCPLYVKDVQLLEEPCGNYVTWDIREGRWNRGELVLAHYFFPRSLGAFFTWAMCKARKKPPPKHTLRTPTEFDKLGAYIAHSALRHMILKPLLLLYIIIRSFVTPFQYYPWMPIYVMIALVLVIPKIPILRWNNLHLILAETLASIIQFSPEPVMGTIRIIKACRAHITGISGWTPQFKVEQDFQINPAIVATFSYQWRMFVCSLAALAPLYIFRPLDILLQFLAIATACLPIYTTLTALPYKTYSRLFSCGNELEEEFAEKPSALQDMARSDAISEASSRTVATSATSKSGKFSSRDAKGKFRMVVDGVVETCMRPAPFFLGPNTISFVQ